MSNDGATSQSSSSDVITTMQGTGSPDARVQALESAMNELHAQMLASSELINALAGQNAQLIKRMEAYRSWMRWLSVFAVAGMIAALVSLVMLLAR